MTKIAKNFTTEQWLALEARIKKDPSNTELWNEAFGVFEARLSERYLEPARIIQKHSRGSGEGFAITAILCSLIEALQSFYEGSCYKRAKERDLNEHEYGSGKSVALFTSFLCTKAPFNSFFTQEIALDFYENVRCALLHEAMTRNGWVIRINTNSLLSITDTTKTLNRRIFLTHIESYIQAYKEDLLCNEDRKSAFIRKMNCICKNS